LARFVSKRRTFKLDHRVRDVGARNDGKTMSAARTVNLLDFEKVFAGKEPVWPIANARLNRNAEIVEMSANWQKLDGGWLARALSGDGESSGVPIHPRAAAIADEIIRLARGTNPQAIHRVFSHCALGEARWYRLQAILGESSVYLTLVDTTAEVLSRAMLHIEAGISRSVAKQAPLSAVVQVLAECLLECLPWHFAAIWEVVAEDQQVRCTWTSPHQTPGLEHFHSATLGRGLSKGIGLPGRAWEQQRAVWAEKFDCDLGHSNEQGLFTIMAPRALKGGLCSGFALPLQWQGEVLMVLEFLSLENQTPSAQLLEFLAAVARHVVLSELRNRTERREQEINRELTFVQERLTSVFNCFPGSVLLCDKDCLDDSKCDVLDYFIKNADDIDGMVIWPAIREILSEVRVKREVVTRESYHADDSRGRQWYLHYVAPVYSRGEFCGAAAFSQCITRRREEQAELANAQRLAALGTLAAGIAHEINTPVQFIGDSLCFLREASDGFLEAWDQLEKVASQASTQVNGAKDELREAFERANEVADIDYVRVELPAAFERCVDGLERVSKIVSSMKQFAHPRQSQMQPSDLNRAILSTLTLCYSEYKYVAVARTELAEIPLVTCHLADVNQVMLNLIVNAAHAIEERFRESHELGEIVVKTSSDGEFVEIVVSDNGCGIATENLPRVFDPFFTTKPVGKGTGQGLPLVWAVVKEKHQGQVNVVSRVGSGTSVIVRLPIRQAVKKAAKSEFLNAA
jgi:signal transduction histidine kinase